MPEKVRPYLFYDTAISLCPQCYRRAEAKIVFDNQGRQTQALDGYGNTSAVKYGAVDRLDTIVDPVGKKLVFLYSGGKLTTIRDPGNRDTRVTVDGSNRLVYDSLASRLRTPKSGRLPTPRTAATTPTSTSRTSR